MKANVQRLRKHRSYSEDFKKSLVKEFESGKFSVLDLSKLHGVCFQSIYRWIYKYSPNNERGYRIVEMTESSSKKIKDLEQKIKQLEQAVGQKQIKIDFLEKMIDLAKDHYDIDIKKNSNTQPSSGSGKTRKS